VSAKQIYRGHLLLAQHVERAGQEHGDRSRASHRGSPLLIGVFEMVCRQGAELGREPGAVQV
jgi:hypothetical protein